jgi:hypothetical protein
MYVCCMPYIGNNIHTYTFKGKILVKNLDFAKIRNF